MSGFYLKREPASPTSTHLSKKLQRGALKKRPESGCGKMTPQGPQPELVASDVADRLKAWAYRILF